MSHIFGLSKRVIRRVNYEFRKIKWRVTDRFMPPDPTFHGAPPWPEDAGPPGFSEAMPWSVSRSNSEVTCEFASAIMDHRFTILSQETRKIEIRDEARKAAITKLAWELPKDAVSGYIPIEWHSDFHRGYKWDPNLFFLDVKIAPVDGADIKIPRELSRFQHVANLACNDLRSAGVEFILQILDWICANPPRRGVNWACSMDIALRAVSWIWGLRLFEPVVREYPNALAEVSRCLRRHGLHIANNLDYYEENTSNHYLSDVVGLLYIGAAFPEFPESDRWVLFALQQLVSEMEREVYQDGGGHEGSTSYHRLVAELFVSGAALAERVSFRRRSRLKDIDVSTWRIKPKLMPPYESSLNFDTKGALLPPQFYTRLARMAEFTAALTKPNGLVPQFGDNDSARAHQIWKTPDYDVRDHSHLPATVGVLLNRSDLLFAGRKAVLEGNMVAGGLASRIPPPPPSIDLYGKEFLFKDSGIAVLRNARAWIAVTCGPNGQGGRGGHNHNDKLSFELNVHGKDFVVDGGCPSYTGDPAMRNRYRSTWAHNTIAIENMEQDPIPSGIAGLFRLPERCRPKLVMGEGPRVIGSHSGYGHLHHREFHLTDNFLTIEDELNSEVNRWLVFNLDPEVSILELTLTSGSLHCRLSHSSGVIVCLNVENVSDAEEGEGCFSKGYGVPVSNRNLKVRMSGTRTVTRFKWSN